MLNHIRVTWHAIELGWKNRELYEVLAVDHLRVKTTFYGDSGEEIDEPTDWLDLS